MDDHASAATTGTLVALPGAAAVVIAAMHSSRGYEWDMKYINKSMLIINGHINNHRVWLLVSSVQ